MVDCRWEAELSDLNKPFSGKVALVTGGSQGIGLAIAQELARQGADIAFNYLRDHSKAKIAESSILEHGGRCLRVRAQLLDSEQIDSLMGAVEDEYGRLDILVNNAASGVQRPALELEERHWDWTLGINSRAPWLCAKKATRLMQSGSHIVNITSLGSERVLPNYAFVGISKAALQALTRYLAVELGPLGISVNAVSAGYIDTRALRTFENWNEILEHAEKMTPAGRLLTAEDVADLVAFLCTERATMIRGQVIVVDGGLSLLG